MYHRVLPPDRRAQSFSTSAIVVTPTTFDRHLRFLKKYFRPLSATELLEYLRAGRALPSRSCLITFDDGWHDNLLHAAPVLRQHGFPSLIFVATDHVGLQGGFWQERMARLIYLGYIHRRLLDPVFRQLDAANLEHLSEAEARPAIRAVIDEIKNKRVRDAERIVEELEISLAEHLPSNDLHQSGEDQFLTWDQMRVLQETSMVEFGSHACSHAPLTSLPVENASEELRRSKAVLEATLNREVRYFAYPNGDCNANVEALVRAAGYQLAFTTKHGAVDCQKPLLRLGRVSIHEAAAHNHAMLLARIVGLI